MEYRGLYLAKALLFRLFWVQLAFLLIAWAVYALCKDNVYPWILSQSGIQVSPKLMTNMVLSFFGLGKFILYSVYLVPALALQWLLCSLKKKAS